VRTTFELATLSKHDIAGIVLAIVAAVGVVWGGVRLAAKAAAATLMLLAAVVLAVISALMFTRTI
jgi:high-affinity Fe2+/Pb2+ permease